MLTATGMGVSCLIPPPPFPSHPHRILPICFQNCYSAFQWQIQKDGDGDDNRVNYIVRRINSDSKLSQEFPDTWYSSNDSVGLSLLRRYVVHDVMGTGTYVDN